MSKGWAQARKRTAGWVGMGAGFGLLALLAGCGGGFFVDTKTTGGSSGTSNGDYIYAVNQLSNTLGAFTVGASVLTPLSGSPYALASGLLATSVAVTRPNTYVYVGGSGAIESFAIGSGGTLTLQNANAATATARFVSLDTSPDGQWLLALDAQAVYVFGINKANGALNLVQTATYTAAGAGNAVPSKVRIAPNGAIVIATLGPGGDAIFTFNTATGALQQGFTLAAAAGYSDNAVTFDGNSTYVYFARGGPTAGSAGVASYSLAAGGALTSVQALATSGNGPFSILLDSAGSYLYTANRSDNSVSGYTVSSGTLMPLAGSPFASGASATTLVEDNSKKYVVAGSFGGASDLTLYAFDALTAGKLDAVATAASGTAPAGTIAVAATH